MRLRSCIRVEWSRWLGDCLPVLLPGQVLVPHGMVYMGEGRLSGIAGVRQTLHQGLPFGGPSVWSEPAVLERIVELVPSYD